MLAAKARYQPTASVHFETSTGETVAGIMCYPPADGQNPPRRSCHGWSGKEVNTDRAWNRALRPIVENRLDGSVRILVGRKPGKGNEEESCK